MNKFLQLSITYIILFLLLPHITEANNSLEKFDKHVIIVVDQSGPVQRHNDMIQIYNLLKETLIYSPEYRINPKTDEISIFAFGIEGSLYSANTSYAQISRLCRNKRQPDFITKKITESLIHKRGNFHKLRDELKLEEYLDQHLKPLFSCQDDLYRKFYDNSGISLSFYVYPLIMDVIDTSTPTKEYQLIIISDYKSGNTNSDTEDLARIKDLVHHDPKYVLNFKNKIHALKKPYYLVENFDIQVSDDINAPVAKGMTLELKSMKNIQPFFNSNVRIQQTDYNQTTYNFGGLEYVMNYNKNKLTFNNLIFNICGANDSVYFTKEYDPEHIHNLIEPEKIDFKKIFSVGDSLNIEALFYVTPKNDQGANMMPLILSASRDYKFSDDDVVTIFEAKSHKRNIKICAVVTIIFATLIAYCIYVKRGRSRKVEIDFVVNPISNTRFMDVNNNKVSSYDCWYWRFGDQEKNIFITGEISIEKKAFAKKYKYAIEKCILDKGRNENFTFRPEGQTVENNELKCNTFYPQAHVNGRFEFNVISYLEPGITPDFSKDNILKLKVDIKLYRINGSKKVSLGEAKSHYYNFIVKPEIENSNLWVALDPGTTGSCIAYGVTSNPTDRNDIFMSENEYEDVYGVKKTTPIYPSKIKINKHSYRLFHNTTEEIKVEDLTEGEDFIFGNRASILWNNNGINCFQSIKKLLGYTEPQKIINNDKIIREISGQALAHMLVKGLYNSFEEFIKNPKTIKDKEEQHIRSLFVKNGKLSPQRAIVAVPNNYTLVKIQEMVDSVKRLNKFQEVHYIYESEATLMNYIRLNWSILKNVQEKIFVVFDMGGATINTTAYKIKVNLGHNNQNEYIKNIEVDTLAKIGYGIGGDDIDYALINIIYNIPSVDAYLQNLNVDKKIHQKQYKSNLIELARRIKLDYISAYLGKNLPGNVAISPEGLYNHIKETLANSEKGANIFINNITENDFHYLQYESNYKKTISDFVLNNVIDSVKELLSSLKEIPEKQVSGNKEIELIFSGRSVLYPGIKECVLNTIKDLGYNCPKPWNGFADNEGNYIADELKKSVAIGACWYAMYSNQIKLTHNISTSSFGYIDTINMKPKYIPVINRTNRFNEEGIIERSYVPENPNLNNVTFVQILGTDVEHIFEENIKHKINYLDVVYPSEISGRINNISINIDNKGNFNYKIQTHNSNKVITADNNPFSRLSNGIHNCIKTEITDENSDAYLFATLNTLKENSSLNTTSTLFSKNVKNRF